MKWLGWLLVERQESNGEGPNVMSRRAESSERNVEVRCGVLRTPDEWELASRGQKRKVRNEPFPRENTLSLESNESSVMKSNRLERRCLRTSILKMRSTGIQRCCSAARWVWTCLDSWRIRQTLRHDAIGLSESSPVFSFLCTMRTVGSTALLLYHEVFSCSIPSPSSL